MTCSFSAEICLARIILSGNGGFVRRIECERGEKNVVNNLSLPNNILREDWMMVTITWEQLES